jgi:isoquinoline 1-oxidoreductase beta subunit
MGKWTRRAFITSGVLAGGVVVLGVAIRPGNRANKVKNLVASEEDAMFNVWVKISPDNTITAIIPHAEMGQGVHTSLAMMLAEELDADWSKVKFEEAPADKQYANYAILKGFIAGDKNIPAFLAGTAEGAFLTMTKMMNFQITGGSSSVRFTGRHAMAVAGAATRTMLVQAAASDWKVPKDEITTEKSMLHHKASNRSATYAEFAQAAAALRLPSKPKLKSGKDYKIIGTSPPRFDIPSKVDGSAQFGIDVMPDGLKYAAVKASPVFGGKLESIDALAIQNDKGILKVVELDNAVAVIADGYWQAEQALKKLNIKFASTENDKVNQSDIFERYGNKLDGVAKGEDRKKDYKTGNVETALLEAEKTIASEYKVPYLAHACMEPMNCTVSIKNGKCDIWAGTQNPLGVRMAVAKALDLDAENVSMHNQIMGGGFGRRGENDVPVMAALIAKEVDFPVKMIWSREETTRQDVYREATISRFQGGLDKDGQPIAYANQYLIKHHPKEASQIPYAIENVGVFFTDGDTHVPWGNWRSVDHTVHGFAIESFIDEMANASGKDGYQFRKELLKDDPASLKVLDLAAEKAGWNKTLPKNWGRGISFHDSFGTKVAEVAEVEIVDGQAKVRRVVCVADPGIAIHPDGFTAQMESGILYGLTAALFGEISIENGAVKQSNFHDYPIVRMSDTPKIETHIITSSDQPGGGGEPSTPGIAAAVTNAIFNATGIRIKELPISKTDLRESNLIG